jgi:Icc protein
MNAPLIILQLTDLHFLAESGQTMSGVDTELSFRQVLEYAQNKQGKADLILITGDLAQDTCTSSYQRIVKELEKYQTRTVCLPGNHDDLTLMQQLIRGKQVNCNKHLKYKHWQVICLNSKKPGSKGGYLASDELEYLADTLKKQAGLNTLIAVHHHPVPTISPWMDGMIIKNSDELFSLLENYPQVKAIICGHIHQELEIQKNNILILGTPSTCFQFEPLCTEYTLDSQQPGYRTLKLFPDGSIKSNVYRLPFALTDTVYSA